jgi:hypothetical protein
LMSSEVLLTILSAILCDILHSCNKIHRSHDGTLPQGDLPENKANGRWNAIEACCVLVCVVVPKSSSRSRSPLLLFFF